MTASDSPWLLVFKLIAASLRVSVVVTAAGCSFMEEIMGCPYSPLSNSPLCQYLVAPEWSEDYNSIG
jgi:hypothetical protein